MARYRGNFLTDVMQSPWWLNAILGLAVFLTCPHVKGLKAGFLPIGLLLSPLLQFLAVIFFIGAIVSPLIRYGKSALGLGQRKRSYFSPRADDISLLREIVKYIFELCKRKWPASQAGTVPAAAWREGGPHNTDPSFSHQPGAATVIGESGAWIDIVEKAQGQGLNIRKIEDIEPLLAHLRETHKPWLDSFHAEIARCIHFNNDQIAALRAEPSFFQTFTNWFKVLGRKWNIYRLYREEEHYTGLLAGNIQSLETLLRSPELAGAKAELEVIDQLRRLPAEYAVFSNIRLRATRAVRFNNDWRKSAQLDHLVLSPAGVFVVETKRWSKKFAETGSYQNPFAQVQFAGYLCYYLLGNAFGKIPVHNIIVSDGSLPPAPPDSHVKVRHLAELNGYITWFNQRELAPDRLQYVRRYLEQYVVAFAGAASGLTDGNPADILSSGFLKEMLREAGQQGLTQAPVPAAHHKSRAVLIPTEPPPLKPNEDLRYMPPAMRKELEDKEKKKRQELLSKKSGELAVPGIGKPHEVLPPNAPKDLKYMPPSMRAEFEEK